MALHQRDRYTVDLPELAPVIEPTAELLVGRDGILERRGVFVNRLVDRLVEIDLGLDVDLTRLVWRGRWEK